MEISVIGLGKLGLPLACCLANVYEVVAVDTNTDLVVSLRNGNVPYYEKGLEKLFKEVRDNLILTDSSLPIEDTDVSFVIVPSPSKPDGTFSTDYIEHACLAIKGAIGSKQHIIVITSTVNPGDTARIQAMMPENITMLYNPEFIALGNVIEGILKPDFVLIGSENILAEEVLIDIYNNLGLHPTMCETMNFINAEIAKIAVNTYITMKISYANTLARLCESVEGGDVIPIVKAMGRDRRINTAYMLGGLGYGGPCFPRDNRSFAECLHKHGVDDSIPCAVDDVNEEAPQAVLKKIRGNRAEFIKTVGILGMTYKPETNVTEESQAIKIKEKLEKSGIQVSTYDPALGGDLEAVMNSQVIIIATPWEEFKQLNFTDKKVIDCWRLIDGGEKLGKY